MGRGGGGPHTEEGAWVRVEEPGQEAGGEGDEDELPEVPRLRGGGGLGVESGLFLSLGRGRDALAEHPHQSL